MFPFPPTHRFSFQSKVLFPVALFLIALPTITVWILDRHVRSLARSEAEDRLASAQAVLINSLEIRDRSQLMQFGNTVNEPRFKSVSLLDAKTIRDYLKSLLGELGEEVEILLYTPISGEAAVGVGRSASIDIPAFEAHMSSDIESAMGGDPTTRIQLYQKHAYHTVSVPVFSSSREYATGTLTIAVKLGKEAVEDLKSLTRTEVLLTADGQSIVSTLPPESVRETLAALKDAAPEGEASINPTIIGGEHFHFTRNALKDEDGNPTSIQYVLLSSYEKGLRELAFTRSILLTVSLLGVAISVISTWILLRRITRPLRSLRDGAEAVGLGDFSQRIECVSNDECGDLANSFNQMTSNLKSSRDALQETVSELQETQEQLIQREARLMESEEGLRLIIEGARDHVIFTIGDDMKVIRWNNAAEKILGYPTEAAQGLSYSSFFDTEDQTNETPKALLDKAHHEGWASFEGWRVRNDGSRFWADVTISRLEKVAEYPGGGYVEIARDITARREAEIAMAEARDAAESSNRAKSEFLANMSHEFRTPMNGIIGMTGLLLEMELDEEQKEFAETIRISADSLLSIIDDVLDIAKIEAGQLEVSLNPVNLLELCEEVVHFFAPLAEQRSLSLNLVFAGDLPPCIETDGNRLRQVLVNLIGNAIKFTEKGGVTMRVEKSVSKRGVTFNIQDTGIGIPEDKIDRLFEPFFQVESSISRAFGGTGLGLAISRNIASLIGGEIRVNSELSVGSTFTLDLDAPVFETTSTLSTFQQQPVLIISKDPLQLAAMVDQLTQWDLSPHGSNGEPENVESALREQNPEVILVAEAGLPSETLEKVDQYASNAEHGRRSIIKLAGSEMNTTAPRQPSQRAVVPVKPTQLRKLIQKALSSQTQPVPHVTRLSPADAQPAAPQPARVSAEQNPEKTARKNGFDSAFASKHPLRLLIVEDNPVNTKVLQNILNKLGYSPDTAENGEKGLQAAETTEYDAILMDLQMPVMDGLESSRKILASDKIKHPVFISAFTANARQDDRDACQEIGMHDFVPKPARIDAITAVLARAHSWLQESTKLSS